MFEILDDFYNYDIPLVSKKKKKIVSNHRTNFILYFTPKCRFPSIFFHKPHSYTIIKYQEINQILKDMKK